jgi:flagellar protein FliL
MSDTAATTPAAEAAPKKKKLPLILIIVVVVALAGGGGFFFLRRSKAAEPEKAEKPRKSAKEKNKDVEEEVADESADEPAAEEGKDKKKKPSNRLVLPDDSKVKKVIDLPSFIINLADKGESHYLRMSVSLGVGESKGEEKPDPLMTTRVRNAMLAVLTTKSSEEILTLEGKAALRRELLRAARAAVEEPRIEAIYITDFIVQL